MDRLVDGAEVVKGLCQDMKADAAELWPERVDHTFLSGLTVIVRWNFGWEVSIWRLDELPFESELAVCREALGVPENPREAVRMTVHHWEGWLYLWDAPRGEAESPQHAS